MALALNVFQTVTHVVGLNTVGIYTAPTGYTGIVLLAQCSNIGETTQTITFNHERTVSGAAVTTEIVKDLPIPANDATDLLPGKLALEAGDTISIRGDSTSNLKFIGSILETLN